MYLLSEWRRRLWSKLRSVEDLNSVPATSVWRHVRCCTVCLTLFISFWQAEQEAVFKKQTIWFQVYLMDSFFLSPFIRGCHPPSPRLFSSDSCLFSPTLGRDLIEGNHSDKKPPQSCCCTCTYVSMYMRASSIQPCHHLSSTPPLKCHVALSTHV